MTAAVPVRNGPDVECIFGTVSREGLSGAVCSDYFNSWGGEEVLSYAVDEEFRLTVEPNRNSTISCGLILLNPKTVLLCCRFIRLDSLDRRVFEFHEVRILDAMSLDGLRLSEKTGGFFR